MVLRNMALVGATAKIQLPAQYKPAFEEGCYLVFMKWTALQLAIENEWGGPSSREKAQQLLEDVIDWFYTAKGKDYPNAVTRLLILLHVTVLSQRSHPADLEICDLEELLDEAIQVDFSVQAEDDSPYQVARSLVNMHNQVANGDMSYVDQLRRMQPAGVQTSLKDPRPQVPGAEDDSSSSSEDDGEEGGDAEVRNPQHDFIVYEEQFSLFCVNLAKVGVGGREASDHGEDFFAAFLLQGGDAMDVDDAPPQGPLIDEDGFQVVQRKGRGRR